MARPPEAKGKKGSNKPTEKAKQAEWAKKAEEKLRKQQLGVADIVWLRDPQYAGRRAIVLAVKGVPGLDRIRVKLENSGKVVELKRTEAVLLSESELLEEPYKGPTDIDDSETAQQTKFFGLETANDKRGGKDNNEKDKKDSSKHRNRDDRDRDRDRDRDIEKSRDGGKDNKKDSDRNKGRYYDSRDRSRDRDINSGGDSKKRHRDKSDDEERYSRERKRSRSRSRSRDRGRDRSRDKNNGGDSGIANRDKKRDDNTSNRGGKDNYQIIKTDGRNNYSYNSKSNNNSNDNDTSRRRNRWLRDGIRVRVISKKASTSSSTTSCTSSTTTSYLQKGIVVDVRGDGLAIVRLDDGSVLDGVKEQYLETVIPSTGAECMVVSGEYMGQKAVLLEKRKEEEAVVVQLKEDLEVVVLSMDAIAATKA